MKIKKFIEFLNEKNTAEYDPPEHAVLPALDPDTQKPNDIMYDYMRKELDKTKPYFSPKISSTNDVNEKIIDDRIKCDSCGWSWKIEDGGEDLYNCHKCGHDNTP